MSLSSAYGSKLLVGFNTREIINAIKRAEIIEKCPQPQDGVAYITEKHEVAPFKYPIVDHETNTVYVDSRPFTSVDRDGSLKIRNELDDKLQQVLAKLELVWSLSEDNNRVQRALHYSTEVFVKWLSGILKRRYGLEPLTGLQVHTVVAMYGIGQFINNIDERAATKHLQSIANDHRIPNDIVMSVGERVGYIFPRDLNEFVEVLVNSDLSPRLKDVSTRGLYETLGGSWWGNTDAKFLTGQALEYPPTMAGLVWMATENSMFKKTAIGDIVDNSNRNNTHYNFQRGLQHIFDTYLD